MSTETSVAVGGGRGQHRYITLDAVRGVAAILIVIRHCGYFFGNHFSFEESYLAVDLFFLLSGFVISSAYTKRLEGGLSPWQFMVLRLIRLYPLYIVGTAIGAMGAVASLLLLRGQMHPMEWSADGLALSTLFAMFMLPTLTSQSSQSLYPLNGPAWSLFYEMGVNFVYAILHPFLSRAVLILLVALGLAGIVAAAGFNGSLKAGSTWDGAYMAIARVIYSFFAGVLIRCILEERDSNGNERLRVPPVLILVAVALGLCFEPSTPYRAIYDVVMAAVVFPIIVTMAALSEPVSARVRNLFGLLGVVSYPIYVIHLPLSALLSAALSKVAHVHVAQYAPWSGLLLLAGLLLLCIWLDRFYDQPLRKKLMDYLFRPHGLSRTSPAKQPICDTEM